MVNKFKVKAEFSRFASHYDTIADVQKLAAHLLRDYLIQLTDSKQVNNILEIGCGTGFFTEQLTNVFPNSQLIATDISLAMVKICQNKIASPNYTVLDGELLPFYNIFDLIASNLTMQWFHNLENSLTYYKSISKNIIFSTLLAGSLREWEELCYKYHLQPGIIPLLNAEKLFAICGEENIVRHEIVTIKKEYHNVLDFLRTIKKIGAASPLTYYQTQNLIPLVRKEKGLFTASYNIGLFSLEIRK